MKDQTTAEILADWNMATDLAVRMEQVGIDPRKITAWLSTVADFLALRLREVDQ